MGVPERKGSGRRAACVLVSGGLDSAVLLRDALRAYRRVQPLYVRSGMRWEPAEIRSLGRLLRELASPRLQPLAFVNLPMDDLYGEHWSTTGHDRPGFHAGDESVYLPGRNIALFGKAGTFCALRGIPVLISGILDGNPFPDSTPIFLRRMERALSAGLGRPVRIRTPFRRFTKDRVVRRGRDLPFALTFSCINPRPGGRHCGDCSKCAERIHAFRRAGISDPTVYSAGPGAGGAPASGRWRRASGSKRPRTTRLAP